MLAKLSSILRLNTLQKVLEQTNIFRRPPSPFFNVGYQNVDLKIGGMFQISTLKKGEGLQGKVSHGFPDLAIPQYLRKKIKNKKVLPTYFVLQCLKCMYLVHVRW